MKKGRRSLVYYSGGTGWGMERRRERRSRAPYADNALCLGKKLDFIVGFVYHQYVTPSNLHTVGVLHLLAHNNFWEE